MASQNDKHLVHGLTGSLEDTIQLSRITVLSVRPKGPSQVQGHTVSEIAGLKICESALLRP